MKASSEPPPTAYNYHYRRPISRKLATFATAAFLFTSTFAFGGSIWLKSKTVFAQYPIKSTQKEASITPSNTGKITIMNKH